MDEEMERHWEEWGTGSHNQKIFYFKKNPLSLKERENRVKFYTSLLNEKAEKIKHPTRRKIE